MPRIRFRKFCTTGSVSVCLVMYAIGAGTIGATEADLVDVRAFDPTIAVELRYAGTRNIAGRALYSPDLPPLVRPSVARKLAYAQGLLRERGYGLKIWDAYRPPAAHEQLWRLSPNRKYVADPKFGGSLHSWGVAIDATLVDVEGRELAMPTEFDEFKPEATLFYAGSDQVVRRNLRFLQAALARAGFYGTSTEWWHFVVKDWKKYNGIAEIELFDRNRAARALRLMPTPERRKANTGASGSSRYAR